MKSRIIPFAIMLLVIASQAAMAEPSVSGRLRKGGDRTSFYTGAGYFIPYEGDFEGAAMYVVGIDMRRDGEALFADVSFSETAPDGTMLVQDVQHVILQLGYRKIYDNGFSFGGGVQSQKMDFGYGIKYDRMMLFGFVEKEISGRFLVRAGASGRSKRGTVNTGGYSLMVIYR